MSNMNIYNKCAEVPGEAKKPIQAGRLKGMTDINPMWRIKKLTEMFGPCGFGWYYDILEERLEKCANDEVMAFVRIKLYYKMDGEWSQGIPGTGGNKLTAKERSGLYNSDECFKMALTDALSVCCKALGMASKVYFQKDRTKYDAEVNETELTAEETKKLYTIANKNGYSKELVHKTIKKKYNIESTKSLTVAQFKEMCDGMEKNPVKGDK